MNLQDQLDFSGPKPGVQVLYNSDSLKYIAIGLGKNQKLKAHKALIPTVLTVLQGQIEFHINEQVIKLNPSDVYDIPVAVEHEVSGSGTENIFTLVQDKLK